jgi:hypothetical protein
VFSPVGLFYRGKASPKEDETNEAEAPRPAAPEAPEGPEAGGAASGGGKSPFSRGDEVECGDAKGYSIVGLTPSGVKHSNRSV